MGSISNTEENTDAILAVTPAGDFNPPLAPFGERVSWALYDFANTVFSMNIATLYFAAWLRGSERNRVCACRCIDSCFRRNF